jgi:hypothetical protein
MSGPSESPSANAEARIHDAEDSVAGFSGRVNSNRSRAPNIFSRARSRGRAEEKRIGPSGRFSRSKSRSRREAEEPKGQLSRSTSQRHSRLISRLDKDSADLRLSQKMQLGCTNIQGNAAAIGLAVGSPSQLQPASLEPVGQAPSSMMETELLSSNDPHFDNSTSKSKGARWRKIGGLFRAKHAFLNDPAPLPFYQLQAQHAAQMANPSDLSFRSPSADPVGQEQEAKFLFDKILGSDGQLNPQKHVQDPLHQIRSARGRTKESAQHLGHPLTRRPPEQTPAVAGLPLLDVKIPEVQMERYSVMFGSLLDKTEPSDLLSRRDRELNQLLTISDVEEKPSEIVPLQKQLPEPFGKGSQNKDQSQLSPQPCTTYPRRATSPAPSKSPSFSLFPQLPQAHEKIVGPIPPDKQSPLQRSFTAPARLSPMQETFDLGEIQFPKSQAPTTDDRVITTPPQTASTWDLKRDSSDPSYLSPISSRPSATEDMFLDIKSLVSVSGSQDQPEVMIDQELKVAPLKPRHVNKDTESGIEKRQQVETEVKTKDKTDVHEDTLAALERPRSIGSKSRDNSGLQPSQARIDQIMRGPSPNARTKGPSETTTGRVLPETSQSKANRETPQESLDASAQRGKGASKVGHSEVVASPLKEEQSAATSSQQQIASVSDQAHPKSDIVSPLIQPSAKGFQQSPDKSSAAVNAFERQPFTSAHPPSKGYPKVVDLHTRRSPPPYQPWRRHPPQATVAERQARPFAENTYHRTHPQIHGPPPPRPPLNAANHLFPTYRSPPQNSGIPLQPSFNQMHPPFNQMHPPFNRTHPPPRPYALPASTPPTEKDQDNILDYYLEDSEAKPSSRQPKSPNKLQKRQPNTSKKRFSFSSKPVRPSYPRSESIPSQTSNTAPRSPVPTSKYSANTAAIQKSVISPPANSCETRHGHSRSGSSTFAEQASGQQNFVSSTRIADEKGRQIVKTPSVQNSSRSRSCSTSTISNPPRRPLRGESSFIVDDSHTTNSNQKSLYSHSNASRHSFGNTGSRPQSPSQGSGFTFAEQDGKPPVPKRSPSRGASLSSVPSPGAGEAGVVFGVGVESRSTMPKLVVPPTRSASAGTVGVGAGNEAGVGAVTGAGAVGIHGHLKPEKGEKVVERQAGLVPRIVDPEKDHERGHRAGKSVNLVIESV